MVLFEWNAWHFLSDRKWIRFIFRRIKSIKLGRHLDRDSMEQQLLESTQVRLPIVRVRNPFSQQTVCCTFGINFTFQVKKCASKPVDQET